MRYALRVIYLLAGYKTRDIPKSTLYITLKTLERLNYVQRKNGIFILTPKGSELAKRLNSSIIESYEVVLKCRWSREILRSLNKGSKSFGILKRSLGISDKILSDRLKKLIKMNLIERKVIDSTYPPTVIYSINENGKVMIQYLSEFLQEISSHP